MAEKKSGGVAAGGGGLLLALVALSLCCGGPFLLLVGAGTLAAAGGALIRYWPLTLVGLGVATFAGIKLGRLLRARRRALWEAGSARRPRS